MTIIIRLLSFHFTLAFYLVINGKHDFPLILQLSSAHHCACPRKLLYGVSENAHRPSSLLLTDFQSRLWIERRQTDNFARRRTAEWEKHWGKVLFINLVETFMLVQWKGVSSSVKCERKIMILMSKYIKEYRQAWRRREKKCVCVYFRRAVPARLNTSMWIMNEIS